jgi:Ran GTPase-activating protein (RanGAP) involved in mRNA processing and transport
MLVVLKGLRDNCKELEILDIRDNFLKEEAAEEMALLI